MHTYSYISVKVIKAYLYINMTLYIEALRIWFRPGPIKSHKPREKRKVCVPVRVGDMPYICVAKKSSTIIVRINARREEMKKIR
jgi:hypothetical protein